MVIGLYWSQGIVIYDGFNWNAYNTNNPIYNVGVTCFDLSLDKYNNKWIADFGLFEFNEKGIVSDNEKKINPVPEDYMLYQNYPNPFNPTTTIQYDLVKSGNVVVKIYNVLGKEIKTIVDHYQNAGKHKVIFDGSNLASCIYLYRIFINNFSITRKMILLH